MKVVFRWLTCRRCCSRFTMVGMSAVDAEAKIVSHKRLCRSRNK